LCTGYKKYELTQNVTKGFGSGEFQPAEIITCAGHQESFLKLLISQFILTKTKKIKEGNLGLMICV